MKSILYVYARFMMVNVNYLMYEKVIEKNCNFVNFSTEMKFKYLVTHECKLLGAFISNCWNIRTQILYSTQCKL